MPNDPRPGLHILPPELTADQVRELGDRAMVEAEREKLRYYDLLRETQDLMKRVDEMLARRP
jgi:hypothetical protein